MSLHAVAMAPRNRSPVTQDQDCWQRSRSLTSTPPLVDKRSYSADTFLSIGSLQSHPAASASSYSSSCLDFDRDADQESSLSNACSTTAWTEVSAPSRAKPQAHSRLNSRIPQIPRTQNDQIVPMATRIDSNHTQNESSLLLTDGVHPNKYKMKHQRRDFTALGIVGGAVVGTMVFPVVGTAVGGAAAGYAFNKLSKQGERRAQRKWEKCNFQRQASQSHTVNAVFV